MDFLHALPRRDLQALAKRNGIKANMANAAMADALAALPKVDGIEEYAQQPVDEPEVQAQEEEKETAKEEEAEGEKGEPEKQGISPHEVIMLDDGDEEEKDEEKAPALGMGRRRATRRAQIEPVAAPATRRKASKAEKGDAAAEAVPAPATRKKAAASKAENVDAAAEAVPTRATRARGQKTVSAAEEEAPKARPTTRRAAARNTGTDQQEEEKGTQSGVSDAVAAVPAPESSDEGDDGAEDMEAVADAQNEEQFPYAEAEKGDEAAEAVPARATRGRSRRTMVSVAEEEAPKTRRTSRRAVAVKATTDHEEQEKSTQADASDVEAAAVPAPATSDEGDDGGAAQMEAAMDAQNDEQLAAAEAEAVPARATRGQSRRKTVVSVAEEEAPKARRTSRRAVARKASTEQEEEEKGDASDMETAAPAPVSSDVEVAIDAHNEEQNEPVEEPVEAAEPVAVPVEEPMAVPARTTRNRSKRTVVSVADEEAPKARRTSRRAVARTTTTEQEEEEKGTQGDVSDTVAAVSAPASSDEGGDGAEEIEATSDAQNEEQFVAVEVVPARATRGRSKRTVVSVAEEEAPKTRRTSRRTGTIQEEEGQGQLQQDIASDVKAAVPAPVSSDVGSDGAEETEVDMEPQNEEQNELVEEQSEEGEGVLADSTPLLEEEEPVAEDCPVDSSVEEQTDTASGEEILHFTEDTEMVPVEEVAQETEDCTVEEEPSVVEHVDSPVQEALVDVQQCEASEEIQASEDAEMVPVNEVPQVTVTSGEPTVEADFTSDVDHSSEENEDCTTEEEAPVEEHVDSSVQELLDIDQCQDAETEEIHLATEDAEVAAVDEVPQATLTSGEAAAETDFTSDVDHASEENEDCTVEEELPVAEDVLQCEATEDVHLASEEKEDTAEEETPVAAEGIHFASEDAEMVSVNEMPQVTSGEASVEAEFTSDVDHASEDDEDCMVEEEAQVAEEVQQYEATEDVHLAEDTEMVHISEVLQATLNSGEVTEEVDFTTDAGEENVEEVLRSAAKASEKKEDMAAQEETLVATDETPQMTEAMDVGVVEVVTVENLFATDGESEAQDSDFSCDLADVSVEEGMVAGDCAVDSSDEEQHDTLPSEATQEVDFASDVVVASEENEDIAADEVINGTDVAVEEETLVATDEMPVRSEAMDLGVAEMVTVDNLSQATIAEDEEVKESDFSCGLADLFVEEQHDNVSSEENQHLMKICSGEATGEVDFSSDADEETEDCTVEQEPAAPEDVAVQERLVDVVEQCQRSPIILGLVEEEGNEPTEEIHPPSEDTEMVPVNEAAEEVGFSSENGLHSAAKASKEKEDMVAVEVQQWSEAMYEEVVGVVTVDTTEEESGFTADLTGLFMEEEPAVAATDEMPQSSGTVEEDVEEEVVTFENLPQVTVSEDEWAVTLSAWLQNMSQVKEMFSFDSLLQATLTKDEEAAVAADEMLLHSSATKEENVDEEVATVEHLSPAKESDVTGGELQAVADAASGDFSENPMASPQSANVFAAATKYLSMDSVTATTKPTVSEPAADVPLCVYSRSVRKLKITEPMSVQRETVAKKPEALGSVSARKALGSVSVRKLKMKFKVDDAPLCIYGGDEAQESEALGSRSLSKLRAEFNEIVAQENGVKEAGKKPSTPLDTLSLRQLKLRLKETLNAQSHKEREPTRVPLGRLDENAW